ncbi:MAG: lysostaphin resistance A-like protein [Planctomycetota bacterium]|jgi:membrane protease YdiL (CAAX protease family)
MLSNPSISRHDAGSICARRIGSSDAIQARRLDKSLLAWTIAIFTLVILTVKTVNASTVLRQYWPLTPAILILAAIIPSKISKRSLASIGFEPGQIISSLAVLVPTCIALFSAMFLGLWLLKYMGLGFPLQPVLPKGQPLILWMLYQLLYVAVAEEVFFRAYVHNNLLALLTSASSDSRSGKRWLSIFLSAACFAIAHIVISGQLIAAVTFVPGIVLGWLFIRTKCLLAPILFHGLANIGYLAMVNMLI